MALVGGLLGGSSHLHVDSDGKPLAKQPSARHVEDVVVEVAVEEHLVTPHTSAVGVLLQKDPVDAAAVSRCEVPLQLPSGRQMCGTASGGRGGGAPGTVHHKMSLMSAAYKPTSPAYTPHHPAAPRCSPRPPCLHPPCQLQIQPAHRAAPEPHLAPP
mmetsp:Transcript_20822/g.45544  ORF Transcript_20822/g.45544 Transcript_20822/m.45544 type:complete len:157 (-) Transcript_20822:1666-2136(-)